MPTTHRTFFDIAFFFIYQSFKITFNYYAVDDIIILTYVVLNLFFLSLFILSTAIFCVSIDLKIFLIVRFPLNELIVHFIANILLTSQKKKNVNCNSLSTINSFCYVIFIFYYKQQIDFYIKIIVEIKQLTKNDNNKKKTIIILK